MELTEFIKIHFDADNNPDGVRVTLGDEDFIIALHDSFDGKEKTWNKAMEALSKKGQTMFSKKQGYLIAAYTDEINAALKLAGGEPLSGWYWTSTDYSAAYAWHVYFGTGYVSYYIKTTDSYFARPVAVVTNP